MCVCVYVYHATRKMAEQYKSSTLTMLLEIGLRDGQCRTDVEAPPHAGEIWRVGGGVDATQRVGTTAGQGHGAVMLILINRGNHCYANAIIKCIIHAAAALGDPLQAFGNGLRDFVSEMLNKQRATHMWSSPAWRTAMREWGQPHRQRDGAEFMQYMVTQQLVLAPCW